MRFTPVGKQIISRLACHALALVCAIGLLAGFGSLPIALRHFPAILVAWGVGAVILDPGVRRLLIRWRNDFPYFWLVLAAGAWVWKVGSPTLPAWPVLLLAIASAGLGAAAQSWFVGRARSVRSTAGEAVRLSVIAAVCAYAIHPYATRNLVGGGDAYHYALQVADAIEATSHGRIHLMVGQGPYAFNGDFHPLRTAPYAIYTATAIHWLSGETLGPVGSLNLLLVLSLFAAAAILYFGLTRLRPRAGWLACVLTASFASSPGILALLYSGDMVASWVTLPWLPVVFFSLVRVWEADDVIPPLYLLAASVAAIWLAHAPIAFWVSAVVMVVIGAWILFGSQRSNRRGRLWLASAAAALGAMLSVYIFASVRTLEMPTDPNLIRFVRNGGIVPILQEGWAGFWRPIEVTGENLTRNLQLGPALSLAAIFGLSVLRRPRPRDFALFSCAGCFLLVLIPVTPIAGAFWRNLPELVISLTDKWPMQRFLPILCAAVPFLAVLRLDRTERMPRTGLHAAWIAVLAVAAVWGLYDDRKFIARGNAIASSREMTERRMRPENAVLSRYSYEYFGRLPSTFTHGTVSPVMQTRILRPGTLERVEPNNIAVRNGEPAGVVAARTRHSFEATSYGDKLTAPLELRPGKFYYVHFVFRGTTIQGTLQLLGRTIYREYFLPVGGGPMAFGIALQQRHGFSLYTSSPDGDEVDLRFYRAKDSPSLAKFVDVELLEIDRTRLPLQVLSLDPFEIELHATDAAWIESPKLFLPGYVAEVDGIRTKVSRSPDGLAMVPVVEGAHRVRLHYEGPLILRMAFWSCAAAWLGLATIPVVRRIAPTAVSSGATFLGRIGAACATVVLILAGLVSAGVSAAPPAMPETPPPVLEAEIVLPRAQYGRWEKLWEFSHGGRDWNLSMYYESAESLTLALVRGTEVVSMSPGIPVNYLVPQDLLARIDDAGESTTLSIEVNHRLAISHPLDVAIVPRTPAAVARSLGSASPFSGRLRRAQASAIANRNGAFGTPAPAVPRRPAPKR